MPAGVGLAVVGVAVPERHGLRAVRAVQDPRSADFLCAAGAGFDRARGSGAAAGVGQSAAGLAGGLAEPHLPAQPGGGFCVAFVFVCFFILTGFLSIAPAWVPGLPWDSASLTGGALGWIAALCALMIVLYPGFFLAKNRSIPFWNTAFLPTGEVHHTARG